MKDVRADFPILKKVVFLDNGASTQKPRQVVERISRFYSEEYANIHRGVYALSQRSSEMYHEARKRVAGFIGADVEEIVFTKGTTESLNMLASIVLPLLKGRKEIVLTELEHHANLIPWQQLAAREGFILKYIPVLESYELDYEKAEEIITSATGLVAFAHVSNSLGTINNAARLIAKAHDVGALAVIDAAQSAPHMCIDVKELDCDFLAFSGHKMCGPTGIGVLYGKRAHLETLEPYQFGGDMIAHVDYEKATWAPVPDKFEAGTPPIAQAIGLGAAIDYLEEVGMDAIHALEEELHAYAWDRLSTLEGIRLHNPGKGKSAGIISFTFDGIDNTDVGTLLDQDKICVRTGHHCCLPLMDKLGLPGTIRASFYLYTIKEEIDALVSSLEKNIKLLR
ncbi:cysteine desulfurase [Candidatus Woesearchaeota archaeon]|nr:cysteine desulfurase [Candidatus Woesearchaeota archaeon]